MKTLENTNHPVQILGHSHPLPRETLTSWVDMAARHGFDAILPLIEKEGIELVNRTLGQGPTDWLFLAEVSSWNRALLIGSDLGAAVEALTTSFQRLVVVEPNYLLRRLLEIRFQAEIAAGRIHVKKEPPDQTDVDLDFLWFMPTIGRSQGSLPLTPELKALLQDCTKRLAPGGVFLARVVRDRGALRDLPLPALRSEPGRGYSLREFEQVFRALETIENGSLEWYWLTSRTNGRSFGTKLRNQNAISYCITRNSNWFSLMGPFASFGVKFVTKRVSSLMLVFRKNTEVRTALKPVRIKTTTDRNGYILQCVMRAVREQYEDPRELAPVLYRSGGLRRDSHATYLLVDSEIGRPMYVARIARSPEGELRLRNEHKLYHSLRQSNGALKSLNAVYYFISNEYTGNSFSIEQFVTGITGAEFAKRSYLDSYSLEWLNWFQKESLTVSGGTFDNQVLSSELDVLQETILKNSDMAIPTGAASPRRRIPHNILKPLFVDLACRIRDMQRFRLYFSAVHGDFCHMNLVAYNLRQQNQDFVRSQRQWTDRNPVSPISAGTQSRVHVYDWEYLHIGVPLLDPWLYVIAYMHLSIHGQVDRQIIEQFLTGNWKHSSRVEQCLAYFARLSGVPFDLLTGYLPIALLCVYAREAARCRSNQGAVQLLRETIISLAINRREVWHYLDTLNERFEKELQK